LEDLDMPSLVVVGAQWGDEGKGKLVDYLTSKADWVARYQGGNNAGHTLVVDGVKTKLSLVPSGILRKHSRCLIGAGVVVSGEVLLSEMESLRKAGVEVTPDRLVLDRDAHLILDYHIAIDTAREEARGQNKIGTTGRGIGPCYEDRAHRCGVRLADLLALNDLKSRLQANVDHNNAYLKEVLKSKLSVNFDEQWSKIEKLATIFKPYIGNVSLLLDGAVKRGEKIVFEGAQGTLLDQCFGSLPYVTSSSTLAGAVTTGCGIGPRSINYVLGVAKAYSTRVGGGPFPTELHDQTGDRIREAGGEFGTVTGRPRRCGWFDAVAMKRAVRLNGIDSLAITKLDVLSGFDKLRICIKYLLDGKEVEDMPALASELDRVEPQFIELDGWHEDLSKVRKWHQLPPAVKLYISTVAEIVACPITIVSVGPDREQTIFSSGASFVKNFV
jgi:adenylosuccinate synthase